MVYGTSTVKRERATQAELAERRDALYEVCERDWPLSVRNAYYQIVVLGLVPKTDPGYRKIQRDLAIMRRDGEIPYGWITDATRWRRKPRTFSSMQQALRDTAATYRRSLWDGADVQVEVWCESESIAGVIWETTDRWDVPLYPSKGFSSMSFIHSAAEQLVHDGRPAVIIYMGDHDPAGLDIENQLQTGLEQHVLEMGAGWLPIEFRRVGVTWEQVEQWGLPGTQPKVNPTRYPFPAAVEAEALSAPLMRELLDGAIREHVDHHQVSVLEAVEAEERKALELLSWTA